MESPHLPHLLQDLLLPPVSGDGADEEAAVVQTHADADEPSGSDLVAVQHLDGPDGLLPGGAQQSLPCGSGRPPAGSVLSGSPAGVHDESVAAVLAAELHHESELVDPAGALEQRHQLVLVHVSGNLPHEDLAAPRRRRPLPP